MGKAFSHRVCDLFDDSWSECNTFYNQCHNFYDECNNSFPKCRNSLDRHSLSAGAQCTDPTAWTTKRLSSQGTPGLNESLSDAKAEGVQVPVAPALAHSVRSQVEPGVAGGTTTIWPQPYSHVMHVFYKE